VIQAGVHLAAQAEPGLAAGLLEDELDHGVGCRRSCNSALAMIT
jgi:hypothetical protein